MVLTAPPNNHTLTETHPQKFERITHRFNTMLIIRKTKSSETPKAQAFGVSDY